MQHIMRLKMMESSLKTWFWVRKNVSGINPSKNWPFQPFTMVKINFIHFSPDLSNFLQFKPILSTGEDFLNFIRIICQPCWNWIFFVVNGNKNFCSLPIPTWLDCFWRFPESPFRSSCSSGKSLSLLFLSEYCWWQLSGNFDVWYATCLLFEVLS